MTEVEDDSAPSTRLSLIGHEGMPGTGRVLREVAKQRRRCARFFPLALANQMLDRKVFPPHPVILGAWDQSYPPLITKLREAGVKSITILWTSPPAQSEMEPFEMATVVGLKRHLDLGTIDRIWFGYASWLYLFTDPKKSFHAPYPLSLRRLPRGVVEKQSGHVSLYGPLHHRKNVLNQLIASKTAGATVHMNGLREGVTPSGEPMKDGYELICDYLGIPYVRDPWMPEETYFAKIRSMEIGLQVSHSGVESLSYVFWDHLMMNVPCLTSLTEVPSGLKLSPDDIHGMVNRILQAKAVFADFQGREWVQNEIVYRNKMFNKTFDEMDY